VFHPHLEFHDSQEEEEEDEENMVVNAAAAVESSYHNSSPMRSAGSNSFMTEGFQQQQQGVPLGEAINRRHPSAFPLPPASQFFFGLPTGQEKHKIIANYVTSV